MNPHPRTRQSAGFQTGGPLPQFVPMSSNHCPLEHVFISGTINRSVPHSKGMKLKSLLATGLGVFLLHHAALCQTNDVKPDSSVVPNIAGVPLVGSVDPKSAPTNEPAPENVQPSQDNPAQAAARKLLMAQSEQSGSSVVTNAAAVSPVISTTNVAADLETNVAPAALVSPSVVVPPPAIPVPAVALEPAPTNPAVAEIAVIPLIQFQEVPITTAIENLARQAGINYLLDPKIGYGQPDQNGQIKPEPTLSIRWEYITAQQALIALLDNYGLQMTGDSRSKIIRITTKDPAAPPPLYTRVIQLKYTSVSNMMDASLSALTDKRSRVVPDVRTSQIIVSATEPEQISVDMLVSQLDKPTRQVLIETRLVEIASNPSTRKGIDWSGTLKAQNITFGNGNINGSSVTTTPGNGTGVPNPNGSATSGGGGSSTKSVYTTFVGNGGMALSTSSGLMPNVGFLNADGLKAVLSFINSSIDAQIVSTPRVVTLDNEMAMIEVTHLYPVFNVSAGSANNAGGSQVNYTNVGTKLKVTPRISANDNIWLKVVPEVSNFAGDVSQSVGGGPITADGQSTSQLLTAPTFDIRTITTQVIIPNTDTLVMGGLVADNPVSTATKVPLLGDLPYLGYAFRSESKTKDKKDLVIFITPTIIKDSDFQNYPNNFLATQPDAKRPVLINPESMWDSTKPYDWSNPQKSEATGMSNP